MPPCSPPASSQPVHPLALEEGSPHQDLKREGGAPGGPSSGDGLDVLLQEACSVPGPHAWLCPEMGPHEQEKGEGREGRKESEPVKSVLLQAPPRPSSWGSAFLG